MSDNNAGTQVAESNGLSVEQVSSLQTQVEQLTNQLRTANEQMASYRQRNDSLRSDMEIIGEALRDEAIERDWCDAYGEFVDKVNRRTLGTWLVKCTTTVEVEFVVTVSVTVPAGAADDVANAVEGELDSWSPDLDSEWDDVEVSVRRY